MFNTTPDMQDLAVYDIDCFLFLNQNICCWYSREPSQVDGSFENYFREMVLLITHNMCFG